MRQHRGYRSFEGLVAADNQVGEVPRGPDVFLRHGTYRVGKLQPYGFGRTAALAHIPRYAAFEAARVFQVDENFGAEQLAGFFPLQREQAFDDEEASRFYDFHPAGARMGGKVVDRPWSLEALAEGGQMRQK